VITNHENIFYNTRVCHDIFFNITDRVCLKKEVIHLGWFEGE